MLKNKTILYTSVALAVIFLGVLFLGVYQVRLENKNISEITNQADIAGEESTLINSIRSIKVNYSKELKNIDKLLIHGEDLVPFIDSVEGMGENMNLKTKIISVVQDKLNDKNIEYPLTVRIIVETDGSWRNSMKFVSALENLPTNVFVENVSLSLKELTVESNKIPEKIWHSSITFSIHTFK